MVLTVPELNSQGFLETEEEQNYPAGDLEGREIEAKNRKNCRVKNEEYVHKSSCHGNGDESLVVDLRSGLPLRHCRKYRYGKERVENDEQCGKGIENTRNEVLHGLIRNIRSDCG